ncbi:MAG: DUF523 and DUF1722 domain-containing protein [Pirellulaceae bacterium]|nr:DUF523 and DUF1722 domain-containing protein [Pirellulaceae bacterium]
MENVPSGDEPIRIGISTCLLGKRVRYDGGHKHDPFLTNTLGRYFEWVPSCPEVEIGLGIPRPTIRLQTGEDGIRLVMPDRGDDLTAKMQAYSRERARQLEREDLRGYVLKKQSPSCGMERVKVYQARGMPRRDGVGLFAAAMLEHFPNLPIEEEGRLHDPKLRENWIERVFAYHRLRALFAGRFSVGQLVDFHTRHKFMLMAHSPSAYQQLGRMVAAAKSMPRDQLRAEYESQFMAAMRLIATTRKNTNVLQHILGFFKKDLDRPAREELIEKIDDYHRGYVPLIVPLTLINHYVRLLDVSYLRDQIYLNPHPKELALRNHV